MPRRTPLLLVPSLACFALAAALLAPAGARADTGRVGVHAGALAAQESGEGHLLPTLRAEASLRLAGPLYAGAYLQGTGSAFPLADAQVAGGLSAALRLDVPGIGVRLGLLAEGGRMSLPSRAQGTIGTWSVTTAAALGIPLAAGAAELELRVGHTWLVDQPASSPFAPGAFGASVGLSIPLA